MQQERGSREGTEWIWLEPAAGRSKLTSAVLVLYTGSRDTEEGTITLIKVWASVRRCYHNDYMYLSL